MHFDERGARRTAAPTHLAAHSIGEGARVIVLGDSHAMGWGVEDYDTFRQCTGLEFGYETVNLGVSSYGTVRELRRLERALDSGQVMSSSSNIATTTSRKMSIS